MKQVIVERRTHGADGSRPRERHVFLAGRQRLAVPLRTDARDVRAYLLFDGERLEVSAALLDVPVTVDGKRVGGAWTPLHTPSVLRVGGVQFDVYTEEDCNGKTSSCRVAVADATPVPHREAIRDVRARLDTLPLDMNPLILATPPAPLPRMITEDTATSVLPRSRPSLPPLVPPSRRTPSLPMQTSHTTISRHRAPIEARRRKMIVAAATGAITAVVTLVLVLGFPPFGGQAPTRMTTAAAK